MTTKAELLKKIRLNCAECMGAGRAREMEFATCSQDIANCTDSLCIFFEFRFGKDPNPNPCKVEQGRKMMAEMHSVGKV